MTKRERFAKNNSPCFKCTERHGGCHSECEKYKAYDIEYRKVRDEELADKYSRVTRITTRHKDWIDKTYPRGK